jgi:hypothetical protein
MSNTLYTVLVQFQLVAVPPTDDAAVTLAQDHLTMLEADGRLRIAANRGTANEIIMGRLMRPTVVSLTPIVRKGA